jgi:hypothetical protein
MLRNVEEPSDQKRIGRRIRRAVATAFLAGAFASAALLIFGQAATRRGPGEVASAALGPALAAQTRASSGDRVPRNAWDGKPNLNGVWQTLNSANWDPGAAGTVVQLGAIGAMAPGQTVVEGGEIPYLPAAQQQKQKNYTNRLTEDPEVKCYLPGIPRATYLPYPFQVIQSQTDILMVYEYANGDRLINMGTPIQAPIDSWMGQSNGKWEGDTLVVDVRSLNGQAWLDRAGDHMTDNAHVVERFTMTDADHIQYEATIEDSNLYTRPWTLSMPLYRRVEKNAQLLEFKCAEFVEELLYGHLRRRPVQ